MLTRPSISIVLEVSHEHPQLKPGTRIGVWARQKLATDAGGWRQINRARPSHDVADLLARRHCTLKIQPTLGTRHKTFTPTANTSASRSRPSSRPAGPQATLRDTAKLWPGELFPDVLRYVVGTPATYGFATRNGWTMADIAIEVMLSLVTGMAVLSGLKPAVAENQGTTSSRTSYRHDRAPRQASRLSALAQGRTSAAQTLGFMSGSHNKETQGIEPWVSSRHAGR